MSDDTLAPAVPDMVVIDAIATIEVTVDECWRLIGGFADAGKFLAVDSHLVAGNGEIGSVRLIGGAIVETMVGHSATSYTYAQTAGPMAPFHYHGCVFLEPAGPANSRLTYTVSYDQGPMDLARRDSERARISKRFQAAADEMKRIAESAATERGGRFSGH